MQGGQTITWHIWPPSLPTRPDGNGIHFKSFSGIVGNSFLDIGCKILSQQVSGTTESIEMRFTWEYLPLYTGYLGLDSLSDKICLDPIGKGTYWV